MAFVYSYHWQRKRRYRPDISDDMFEYALQNSAVLKDKEWSDALNAICRIPPMGRTIKVVYRQVGANKFKIITAYWLD